MLPLRRLPVLAWLLTCALGLPLAGQEEREEILSFDVDVVVADGGALTVTETLRVRALGHRIRRGIFRDIPTRFPRPGGIGTVVAPLEVISVTRDGEPEPYRTETVEGPDGRSGVRVRIGDADVVLDPAVYTYAIAYRTERWMRFGESRDTLSWNATGNGWEFPILSASARIALPEPVERGDLHLQAWTGPAGSTEEDARIAYRPEDALVLVETTAPLAAREGLTVEVGLPANVVAPPTDAMRRSWFWLDWGGYVEAGAVSLLVLGLYLGLWVWVGRDPPGPSVMVRYEPPEDFSPAALGYVQDRCYSTRLLTASLVKLAVAGAVRLHRDDDDTWRVEPTGDEPERLEREERRLLANLTPGGRSLTLKGSTSSRLRAATTSLKHHLEQALEGRYFVLNRRWFVAGLVLSLVAFGALALRYRYDVPPEAWFLGVWLTGWSLGTAALVGQLVRAWGAVFRGRRGALLGAPALTLFSLPFIGAELFVAGLLYRMAPGHLVAAAVVIGVLNVVFFHLLERPTLRGRGVLDHLEGFRRFLEGTEQDRFDRMQDPGRSLEFFERYLPHAIALGVENRWAERFDAALSAAHRTGAAGTRPTLSPTWYSGTGGFEGATGLTRSLGSSFGSTLSSSSAAPSSGSGGGGSSGGSSGGGGGGGGGGGW